LNAQVYYYDLILKTIDGKHFSRGTGYSRDEAFARAVGELLERTSLRYKNDDKDIIYSSYNNLIDQGYSVADTDLFAQRTDEQKLKFPYLDYDKDSVIGWVEAVSANNRELKKLVPAHMVYWGYKLQENEPTIYAIDTGGLGAGYTVDDALASSLGEITQRNAFMYYWYHKKTPDKVSLDSILLNETVDQDIKNFLQASIEYGFEVNFLDLSDQGGVPSVCCVISLPGMGYWMAMSSNSTFSQAIYRSLSEAISIYTWTLNVSLSGDNKSLFSYQEFIPGFCDSAVTDTVRVTTYAQESMKKHMNFLVAGIEISLDTAISRLKESSVLEYLSQISNNEVWQVEASNPLLEKFGFCSLRCVVPGTYRVALYEVGSSPILNSVIPSNIFPHPFP
jgi:thiazole/oxazole-forming peptide maturase SagD family component